MIGGFLGAGKTTTIARLAHRFRSQGKNVIIVTNDQAADLVDTNSLRSQGFDVGEVAGSCFCCNFNALTDTIENLSADEQPDVILAEPVGSCTDLVATVIRPLQQVYAKPFSIAPYGVILKPSHGAKILSGKGAGGFSPQAEYIFRKQLEEADFIILNRIDELSQSQRDQLRSNLEHDFPGRAIIAMSAKTGSGFDAFCEYVDQEGAFGQRVMDVDYDVYAEGEAELGWLNAQLVIESPMAFNVDDFLMSLIRRVQSELNVRNAETAHIKAIAMCDGKVAVSNLVSSFTEPTLSLSSSCESKRVDIVLNARVAIDPDSLAKICESAIQEEANLIGAQYQIRGIQSFRPGRPVPTHRL